MRRPKILAAASAAVVLCFAAAPIASAQSSTVAYSAYSCDYFVVSTGYGNYSVLEWYGGSLPYTGMRLYGLKPRFGFQRLGSGSLRMSVWVEGYWLSARQAARSYRTNCS